MKIVCSKLVFSLLAQCTLISFIQGAEKEQSPFPQLFDLSQRRVKIVSESVSDATGYSLTEEYIDLDSGRAAIVAILKDGLKVLYQDAEKGLSYKYKPYTCNVQSLMSLKKWLDDDVPLYNLHIKGSKQDETEPQMYELRLPGVAGLWMIMGDKRKMKQYSQVVNSGSKKAQRDVTCWAALHKSNAQSGAQTFEITFCFAHSLVEDRDVPTILETVEVKLGEKIIKTLNIISVEYLIKERDREEYLNVPAGYGCFNEDDQIERTEPMDLVFRDMEHLPFHLKLEVTGTFHDTNEDISDTWNVEIAKSKLKNSPIRLFHLKHKFLNVKTVYNHLSQVAYKIDVRKGTCEMMHLEDSNSVQEKDEAYEHGRIKFKNGLTLDINQFLTLMAKNDGCHFIKRIAPSARSPSERMVYEAKLDGTVIAYFANIFDVRAIRVYSQNGRGRWKLQSVSIWAMTPDKTKLQQSILVNVIEAGLFDDIWPDQARTFDVSEECYLNNDKMIQNRDYAWIKLKYYADARALRWAKKNERDVEKGAHKFVTRLVEDQILRMPRFEVSLDDDAIIVRVLILDLPPLEYRYRKLNERSQLSKPDIRELAPDLDHCAHLCRLHHCTVMTYCAGAQKLCITNSDRIIEEHKEESNLIVDSECDTWLQSEKNLNWISLHSLLSRLRHTNYESAIARIPKIPEEVWLSIDESGLTKEMHDKVISEYQNWVKNKTSESNELLLPVNIVHLLPSEIELEKDPLSEFDLNDIANIADDDDEELEEGDDKVPAFHIGSSESRFKLKLEPKSEQNEQVQTHQMIGLTYDQCALACKDSRCGTFSYCSKQTECTLSSANTIGQARRLDLIEHNIDCLLMERDFLNNYHIFHNVKPSEYSISSLEQAGSASECALKCVAETDYTCLSFQYCAEKNKPNKNGGKCYFWSKRDPQLEEDSEHPIRCDHYSRSYLADFNRFEYRAIADDQMKQLQTTTHSGLSVFACAEKCATELADCTAFQSCHLISKNTGQFRRECTLIQGRSQGNATIGKSRASGGKSKGNSDASNFFEHSQNCQVFSLRKDSIEAHLRDLALGTTLTKANKVTKGLNFGGAMLFFICLLLISATLACGFVYLRDTENRFFRTKFDRLRYTFGF